MNRTALLLGLLVLTTANAQSITPAYDAGTNQTTLVVQCPGDQRAALCGPLLQLIEGGQPTDAVVLFRTPMDGEYAGVQATLPEVMAAASTCIVCTPEQRAAEVAAANAQALSNAYDRAVNEARQILQANQSVRQHPNVVAAWEASRSAPSALLPPQVVVAVRLTYRQLRAEAIAARKAAAEAARLAAEGEGQ